MKKPESKLAQTWTLPTDRPASIDEKGYRRYIHPSEVTGRWKSRRQVVQAVLLVIFLGLPWLQYDGRQALLINLADRHFDIFGLSLRAHNAPLLFFVFAVLGFGLFLVTAIWGRVWCGWACPQTVFIEAVFRRIETWVEGPAQVRRAAETSPLTLQSAFKKSFKWTLFLLASLVLTHSFLAYFVGTESLAQMIRSSPRENWPSFLFIAFSTAVILFDFGWFREQFCVIACPYGRFQSVLMDQNSQVVAYDAKREDCVNCFRCVQVCPTGIDIRRGVQLECIACTACIDACDDVMTKTKKPTGLIAYFNQLGERHKVVFSPRLAVYAGIILISISSLTYALIGKSELDIQVFRGSGVPYIALPNGRVLNQYFLETTSTAAQPKEILIRVLSPLDGKIVNSPQSYTIRPGLTEHLPFFIEFTPETASSGQSKGLISIEVDGQTEPVIRTIQLVSPIRN